MSDRKFDSNEDVVKLASLYILFSTFLVKAKTVCLLPKYIRLANDMAFFNAYMWEKLSYEMTKDSINNIVILRLSSQQVTITRWWVALRYGRFGLTSPYPNLARRIS